MKKWERTTIHWIMVIDPTVEVRFWARPRTTIPINGMQERWYECTSILATALLGRTFRLAMSFRGCSGESPSFDNRAAIEERVRQLKGYSGNMRFDSWKGRIVNLDVDLKDGEQFSTRAVELVRELFQLLGIEDSNNHMLAEFTIARETLVWKTSPIGEWIKYEDWMRSQFRLPDPRHHK